jgi:hypothetical protein
MTSVSATNLIDGEMQLVNKERLRKIRNELLTTIPQEGTPEREMCAAPSPFPSPPS